MAITAEQYLEAIGRAGLTMGDLVVAQVGKEKQGCVVDWSKTACYLKLIRAAEFFYSIGDYISTNSVYFYNQVLNIAGSNYSTSTLDPNAQVTNTTIIVNQIGSTVNSAKIYFTNVTTAGLLGYIATYYVLYGNNPDVSVWLLTGTDGSGNPVYNEDAGTSPTINTDAGGNITSITWDYPVPTSGYISITGVQP